MDNRVMLHMGGAMSEDQVRSRLKTEEERQMALGISYWPVFHLGTGEHVGCAGLRPFHNEFRVYELGVHIAHSFWSDRYGEEAARAVMEYSFSELEAHQVVAGHGPRNVHSKALIGRLGFILSHEEPWGPEQLPHPFYRITRSRYAAIKEG